MFDCPLHLLDLTLPTPPENLALDEVLLQTADQRRDGFVLRFWEPAEPFVVVGRSCRLEPEIVSPICRRDGVSVLRRCSGGGSVLLGPGCLAYSLILPVERPGQLPNVSCATKYILRRLADALRPVAAEISHRGTSDLAVDGLKVSGNSQRWLKHAFLHHGTLLFDFDVTRVSRYLRIPPRQPDYRAGRSHEAFLTNLPADGTTLRRLVTNAWTIHPAPINPSLAAVDEFVCTKYGTETWNRNGKTR